MTFHVNRRFVYLTDNLHEMSILIFSEKKIFKVLSVVDVINALRVKKCATYASR